MKHAWSRLPNAAYIDRVVASYKKNPDLWHCKASESELHPSRRIAYDIMKSLNRTEIWFSVGSEIKPYGDRARDGAWNAIAAFLAWDDCAYMLESNPDELAMVAALGDVRAILLSSACTVFQKSN